MEALINLTQEKYIEKTKSQTVKTQEKQSNLFASNRGSTVMTQAASELGDEMKKQNKKCTGSWPSLVA